MFDQLHEDCLETIFRFCHSDELLSLCCVHPKLLKTIERLEIIHLEYCDKPSTSSSSLSDQLDNNPRITTTTTDDASDRRQQKSEPTTGYMGTFLRPTSSSQNKCEKTQYRLQIYHPSYTVRVVNNHGNGKVFGEGLARYLIDKMNFIQIEDDSEFIVVEREMSKSSFVKSLREKLSNRVNQLIECGKSVSDGIMNIIDTEFKPYSSKNQQHLINFYDRLTLRLIIFKFNMKMGNNHFMLASGQVFHLFQGGGSGASVGAGMDSTLSHNYSDRVIGIRSMTDHFGNTPEIVADLMLSMILQQTMPKYYYENYRIPEDFEHSKELALVDVFYYEMLNGSSDSQQNSTIPVFCTQNYLNSPFELFKHGLEMSFDLLYNQLSTRKKIELVEKLITAYLDQKMTPEFIEIIQNSKTNLHPSDIESQKYISVTIGDKILTFVIVAIESVTTVRMTAREERVKTVTSKLVQYTLQLPNLFNGNTIDKVRMSSKTLKHPNEEQNNSASVHVVTTSSNNRSGCNVL